MSIGETLGLVGESGCGNPPKSLYIALNRADFGRDYFDGDSVLELTARQMRLKRRYMQIIFQDPYGSLDPRQTIGSALIELMEIHGLGGSHRQRQRAQDLRTGRTA